MRAGEAIPNGYPSKQRSGCQVNSRCSEHNVFLGKAYLMLFGPMLWDYFWWRVVIWSVSRQSPLNLHAMVQALAYKTAS